MPPSLPARRADRGGRLLLRMPTTLHEELVEAAEAEGISLNQFICYVLTGAVRWRTSRLEGGELDVGGVAERNNRRLIEEAGLHIWRFP